MTGTDTHLKTFAAMLIARAARHPSKVAFRFFRGAELAHEDVDYHSLWRQAAALAYRMQSEGLTGKRVLVVCRSQKNFVIALFACLLGGIVAVPTAPPRRRALLERLRLIVEDATPGAIVFDCDDMNQAGLLLGTDGLRGFDIRHASDEADVSDSYSPITAEDSDIAFIQYTSGSVAEPKGVVIRHTNIKHNCAAIKRAMSISEDFSFFGALPLFHDMGLVGGLFLPFFCGSIMSYLSPIEFVQYPERWLQIISRFKCTISGGPNFMYDLAARTVGAEVIDSLDLSCWKVAFCGAEPVRAATLDRFKDTFRAAGFSPGALYPCYGLAEATLFVSGGNADDTPTVAFHGGKDLIGCGWPHLGTTLRIVDPEGNCEVPEGDCGEIWVAGEGVSTGYWNRPELTATVFNQRLSAGDAKSYMRTGDMGFIRNGELFVVGRLKDLIVINGANHAPDDLEREVQLSHPAVDHAGCAAFSIEGEVTDLLVVVAELRREWVRRKHERPAIISAIRAAIRQSHDLAVFEVVLIRPGALPRTSSGKVRRRQCRVEYLANSLGVVTVGAADRLISGRTVVNTP